MDVTTPYSFPLPDRIVNALTITRSDECTVMIVNYRLVIFSDLYLNFLCFPLFLLPYNGFFIRLFSKDLILIMLLPVLNYVFRAYVNSLLSG